MSDAGNTVFSEEEEYVDTEDSIVNHNFVVSDLSRLTRKRKSTSELRQPRGKFSLRWERDFPWVRADNIDESLGICTVCKKQLVCKKSHLERHEKSYKHQRMLAGTQKSENSTANSAEFLDFSNSKLDWSDEDVEEQTIDAIEFDSEYCEDIDIKPMDKQEYITDVNSNTQSTDDQDYQREIPTKSKINRHTLLKRIDRSRSQLHDYYNSRIREETTPPQMVMAPARDSFDLFFDSVSASVKTLPPKLAAEVKSRVSQLIAEFELRAICEREAAMVHTENIVPYTMQTIAHHVTPEGIEASTAHIVYTIEPKLPLQ